MSMGQREPVEIPAETVVVVRAACPKGTRVTRLRDVFGPVFTDVDFSGWFGVEGRRGLPPGMLVLVSVLRSMENLTDRDAADAVRTRLDWKYALGLPLADAGFDFSVLSEFRDRLVADERAGRLLDAILAAARAAGLSRAGGRARTDSTHVLANVRDMNRLELVGETVRVALEMVAEVAPGWISSRIQPGWEQRYTRRIESSRLPVGALARTAWGAQTATGGVFVLSEIDADPDAAWIGRLPRVAALRAIWEQQCVPDGAGRWQLREVRISEGAVHIDNPRDVQARWSTKRSTVWTGYKVHLTETCDAEAPHLITQVQTTTATLTDLDAIDVIHVDLDAKGLTPVSTISMPVTSPRR